MGDENVGYLISTYDDGEQYFAFYSGPLGLFHQRGTVLRRAMNLSLLFFSGSICAQTAGVHAGELISGAVEEHSDLIPVVFL